ncbi:MAG: CheR family methyltransferase [Cyanobacteria bacterium J06636_16]
MIFPTIKSVPSAVVFTIAAPSFGKIASRTESEEEQKLLRQDLLIGATCFFRDQEAWEFLKTQVLPRCIEELQPQRQLRIWVSACATGEPPIQWRFW